MKFVMILFLCKEFFLTRWVQLLCNWQNNLYYLFLILILLIFMNLFLIKQLLPSYWDCWLPIMFVNPIKLPMFYFFQLQYLFYMLNVLLNFILFLFSDSCLFKFYYWFMNDMYHRHATWKSNVIKKKIFSRLGEWRNINTCFWNFNRKNICFRKYIKWKWKHNKYS